MSEINVSDRPLVTFALFAYNQEAYIREAVEGAFAQTYKPLEIILSDDCSKDRTFEIMQNMAAVYEGPHEVRVRRNSRNLGVADHVNQVLGLANGKFVVMAAGDDISLPERANLSVAPMVRTGTLNFVEVGYIEFTDADTRSSAPKDDGIEGLICLRDRLKRVTPATKGAVRTIRLSAAKKFPPMRAACPTEDTPMVMRLLYSGSGAKISDVACYLRRHRNNLSLFENRTSDHWEHLSRQFSDDVDYAVRNRMLQADVGAEVIGYFERRQAYDLALAVIKSPERTAAMKIMYPWIAAGKITLLQRLKLTGVASRHVTRERMRRIFMRRNMHG